jgi:DedD protein
VFDIEAVPEDSSGEEIFSSQPNDVEEKSNEDVEGLLKPAWVLQIASFESKQRALELLKELEAMRYRGFLRNVETSKGSRTRIYVGPNVSKSTLEEAKTVIDKKYQLDSILLKFRPD